MEIKLINKKWKFYIQDKIKDKLIDKNIIKGGDNIPFKILFQLYINDLKNDLELKIC